MNNLLARVFIYLDILIVTASVYPVTALFWKLKISRSEIICLFIILFLGIYHFIFYSDYLSTVKGLLCFLSFLLGKKIAEAKKYRYDKYNAYILIFIFVTLIISVASDDFSTSNRFVYFNSLNPNYLATALLVILIINFFKPLTYLLLPFITLTLSRSVIGPILFSIISRSVIKKNSMNILIFAILVLGALFLIIFNPIVALFLGSRFIYTWSAINGLEFSFLGFGTGHSFFALALGFDEIKNNLPITLAEYYGLTYVNKTIIDPHNSFITAFSDFGLMGFLLFSFLIFSFIRRASIGGTYQLLRLVSCLTFVISLLTHNMLFSRELFLIFGFVTGLLKFKEA